DRPGVVERLAGVARQRLIAEQLRVVDDAVAVVVDPVAGGVERALVDEGGIAALGGVAAVAAAGRDPVAVLIDVLVDHPVAVVVDAVAAALGDGHHLAEAPAPGALLAAGAGALRAGADAGGAVLAGVAGHDAARLARGVEVDDLVLVAVADAGTTGGEQHEQEKYRVALHGYLPTPCSIGPRARRGQAQFAHREARAADTRWPNRCEPRSRAPR